MREILSEASRLIRNRHFALAVLIMLIAFSGYAACDWVFMYDWDVAYRSSSLQQTLGGIYFRFAPPCRLVWHRLKSCKRISLITGLSAVLCHAMRSQNWQALFWHPVQQLRSLLRFMHLSGTFSPPRAIPLKMIISLYLLRMIASSRRGKRYFTACPSIFGLPLLCFSAAAYGAW